LFAATASGKNDRDKLMSPGSRRDWERWSRQLELDRQREREKQARLQAKPAGDDTPDEKIIGMLPVDGALAAPDGRRPRVRVIWFIETSEDVPHLVTAYPLEKI